MAVAHARRLTGTQQPWKGAKRFGVRQLAAAFFQASLLAERRMLQQSGREQSRWAKTAASCRTPMRLWRHNFQSSEWEESRSEYSQ
jgi:hypothetical protein